MLWASSTLTHHQSPSHLLFSFLCVSFTKDSILEPKMLIFHCGHLIRCLTVQKAFQMVGSGGSPGYQSLLGSQLGTGMLHVNDFRAHPFFLLLSGMKMLFSSHWVRPCFPPPRLKEASLCLEPTRCKASLFVSHHSVTHHFGFSLIPGFHFYLSFLISYLASSSITCYLPSPTFKSPPSL